MSFPGSIDIDVATAVASSLVLSTTETSAFADSATTTFESFVQVTATESAIATQDGVLVTVKPLDVYSSA
jgi:hypothetical protein